MSTATAGHHDRISDAYKGLAFSTRTQELKRQRIHWMCAQAVGKKLLDVGCSQGITSILLGRDGFSVTGVDVEKTAIDYALEDLSKEPQEIQRNVTFICGDILTSKLEEGSFDTVIIGEVLEHLEHPEKILEHCSTLLKEEGLLIITTPFGLMNPMPPDHKQIFYLSGIYQLLSSQGFVLDKIENVGKWLCCTAYRSPKKPKLSEFNRYLVKTEDLFKDCEELYIENNLALKKRINRLLEKTDSTGDFKGPQSEELKAWKSYARRLQNAAKLREDKYKQLANKIIRLEKSFLYQSAAQALMSRFSIKHSLAIFPRMIHLLTVRLWRKLFRLPIPPIRFSVSLSLPPLPKAPGAKNAQITKVPPVQPGKAPTHSPANAELVIAGILSDYMRDSLAPECVLYDLSNDNSKSVIENKPDLLLVETCEQLWEWQANDRLDRVLDQCEQLNIPTAFWHTAGQKPLTEKAFGIARFNAIFVADKETCSKYREAFGGDTVHWLPLAIQPRYHNPIVGRNHERLLDVGFLGDITADEERDLLINPALSMDLHILNSGFDTFDEIGKIPERLQKHMIQFQTHEQLSTAIKDYKVILSGRHSDNNANADLFRRNLEIFASGTSVISTPIEELDGFFNTSLVPIVNTSDDTHRKLRILLKNQELADRLVVQSLRNIMSDHTYRKRIHFMLETLGMHDRCLETHPKVSMVAATNRLDYLDNIFKNYNNLVWPSKELIMVLNNDDFDSRKVSDKIKKAGITDFKVISVPEKETLGDCLNASLEVYEGDYWQKFDDDDFYGPHFVDDLVNSFAYTDAGVAGKHSRFAYMKKHRCMTLRGRDNEFRYVTFVPGATFLVKRDILNQVKFPRVQGNGTDSYYLKACTDAGVKIYSGDRFNFACVRHGDPSAHTWKISDEEYWTSCQVQYYGDTFEHVVT